MHFIYIDESGDNNFQRHGVPKGSSRYFLRAGVIIPKDKWFTINSKIKEFRAKEGIPNYVEFHATEIIRGSNKSSSRKQNGSSKKITTKNFFGKKFKQPQERVDFIERYIKTIIVSNDINIVATVICKDNIDKKQFIPNNLDHNLKNRSLTFLTEKIDLFLTQNSSKGLMVFDHVGISDDSRHRKYQKSIYRNSENINNKNFIETMCFAPSEESEFLQMADIVSNSIYKHLISGDYNPYKIFESKIFHIKYWPSR